MNIQEIRAKYPQYSDLSDEQLGKALHTKFYADMPYEQFAQKAGLGVAPKESGDRGMWDSLGRQLALTLRSAVGGVGGIANAVADPVVSGINAVSGANLPIPSQALDRTMTRAGLPEPASGTEKFAQAASRGLVAPAAIAKAFPQMAAHLGTQIAASGSGAGSANLAEQGGFGPLGQTVAGLAGGVVAPIAGVAAVRGAEGLVRGGMGLVEPFTKEGQRTIAARAYQGAASDKQAALDGMDASEIVPGSKPTTAQATGDKGLASMEKTLRNRFPQDFADRAAAQDSARQAYLEKVFGGDVAKMESARGEATSPMRQAAFEAAGNKKIDTKPVLTLTNSIMKSGAGKREEVEKAMKWVNGRLEGETNAQRLDAIRQDINDIIAGKMDRDPEKASLRLASKELASVRARIVDAINQKAPLYREYLKEYGEQSIPIEKQKLGKNIWEAATNNTTERLSTPKFANQVVNNAEDIGKTMGAQESDTLMRVLDDMRRAAGPEAAMRAPGSDTSQNLIAQNILQSAIGPGKSNAALPRMLSKGLGWLYTAPEEQIQQLMLQGALDPEIGRQLLAMRLRPQADPFAGASGQVGAASYGGLLGVNTR
jgi:hypothetical protein